MREIRYTERLRLEPVALHHAGDLWRLHWDEAVATWFWGRWTAQMAIDNARRMARGWDVDGVHKWMAYDRMTGELVGRGGLSYASVDGERRLELGWSLLGSRWGSGYATEIGRAGLALAAGLPDREVVAFTETHNTRSSAVMRRLGMRYSHDIVHHGAPFVLYRTPSGSQT